MKHVSSHCRSQFEARLSSRPSLGTYRLGRVYLLGDSLSG